LKITVKYLSIALFLSISVLCISFGQQKAEWKGKIETEDGIKVIKNPEEPLYGEIQFELEEDLSIGNEDDENCYFYKTIDIDVDSKGNIYVMDSANYRIQKFDKNGKYIMTFGRQGQGPGEFESTRRLQIIKENQLCVLDRRRIHVFSEGGELENSIRLENDCSHYSFASEGSIVCKISTIISEGINEEIILLSRDGKQLKSYITSFFPVFRKKNMSIIGSLFNPGLYFCPWSKGSAIYGHSSEYKLFFLDSSGTVVLIAEIEETPKAISQKEKNEYYKKRYEAQKKMEPQFPSRETLSMSEIKKAYPLPKNMPFFMRFFTDEEGNVYVFRIFKLEKIEKMASFDFFSNEGYFLHRVKMPFLPRVIKDGYVYREKWEQERGFFRIKRFKIKNWKQIKEGI
jgi:hypothetical protein